jgi:protein subunit release factor A
MYNPIEITSYLIKNAIASKLQSLLDRTLGSQLSSSKEKIRTYNFQRDEVVEPRQL